MLHSSERVTVAGATIRMLRGGSGPPLVFLHGAGGHTGWMVFLEALSQRFPVFAPEHPGFGQSDDPPWLDTVGDLAYFYLDLLSALGLDRVHLMGTSLGGWITAEVAVRNTARLASLTLIGAVGVTAEGEPIPDIFRMSVEENLQPYYADPQRAAHRLGDLGNADMNVVAKNRTTVTRLAYRPRFHNPDLGKWLDRIDVPTLLIWGAQDGLVPPRFGEAYRALIPGARLVVRPGGNRRPSCRAAPIWSLSYDKECGLQPRQGASRIPPAEPTSNEASTGTHMPAAWQAAASKWICPLPALPALRFSSMRNGKRK